MDHYKETGCSTTAVPALMDGEEVHIDDIFVMPSMRIRNNTATGRENRNAMPDSHGVTQFTQKENKAVTTIYDLFQKDGKSIRRICISGVAGQGKTTLCRKIVSTWCKVHSNIENVPDTEHQFLKSFDLLFYLPLRNNKLSDVIEMIKTDIVRKSSHNALKDFLKKESEKCLIILDGLDEWLPSEDCEHKVPYINPSEKYTVLITSRPWKLEDLRITVSEIGQEVELIGIENDELIVAVVDLLNNKCAKKRNWKHFKYNENGFVLNETYEKVNHLAEIPIILTQMVCMWYDDATFGNTRVKIYNKMLDYLFQVENKRCRERLDSACMKPQWSTNTLLVNVFKYFSYCQMYSEILFKLSDLAYHTLFIEERENSLIYPHSVTKKYKLAENDVKFCLSVGILSQKKSSHTKSISFLHKTFHEFLAALYIAYGGNDRSFAVLLDALNSLDDVFEKSQVLIFLSGLKPDLLGDISRHIAQLTDTDERVLQYRNSLGYDVINEMIDRLQNIIYECIVEAHNNRMVDYDLNVELHDVLYMRFWQNDKVEKMIPFLNLENVKSWIEKRDVPSKNLTELKGHDLVKLGICIESQEDTDHVTSTVERCASSLTCLSVAFRETNEMIIVNIDDVLTALKKVRHLTCLELSTVNLTHSDIEYLGTTLSQSTQLKEICLSNIRCRTCQWGDCYYIIDLSHHKQLQYLYIGYLDGDIVLSNEVPVERCDILDVKCAVSILDTLKPSTNLHWLKVESCDLYNTNSVTSSTTTVQDDEREVDPTPLGLSKVLTDVIPTLKNLKIVILSKIDFKQDILRLSPEMTSLEEVNINSATMTLQCLQGFIDSLPQAQFYVQMWWISICPKEDMYTALKYVTDRYHITSVGVASHMKEDGRLYLQFTNTPSH